MSFKISDTQNLNNIHQTYENSSSNDKIISVSKNNNEYLIKALDEGHSVINVKSFILARANAFLLRREHTSIFLVKENPVIPGKTGWQGFGVLLMGI